MTLGMGNRIRRTAVSMARVGSAFVFVLFGLAQPARAEKCPEKNRDACAIIWSAEKVLSEHERRLLEGICLLTATGARAQAKAEWDGIPETDRKWLLRRMAGWQLGAQLLSKILPPEAIDDREDWEADEFESEMRKHAPVKRRQKVSFQRQLDNYIDEYGPNSSFSPELANLLVQGSGGVRKLAEEFGPPNVSWASPPNKTGNGAQSKAGIDPQSWTLLIFFGSQRDAIRLVVGDPYPSAFRARRATVSRGWGVYFAVVPRGALLSVSVERPREPPRSAEQRPERWSFPDVAPSTEPEAVRWLGQDRSVCVELAVAMEPSAVIYLDGQQLSCREQVAQPGKRVRRFRTHVSRDGWHELAVIGRPASGGPRRVVLASKQFSVFDVATGHCHEERLDLRQRASARTVALLGVRAGELCPAAGVDRARLRHALARQLRRLGRAVKDIETWTDTIEGLGALKEAIQTLGGVPVGAERGRLDTFQAVGMGAAELKRRGFGTVVSAMLECSRHGEQGRWEYSLVGRRLDVQRLIEAARDTVTGIDLDDVVQSHIELATERSELRSALGKLLGHMFDRPYLRFDNPPAENRFLDALELPVEVKTAAAQSKDARRAVVVRTRPLGRSEARRLCRCVELAGSLGRSRPEGLERDAWHSEQSKELPLSATPVNHSEWVLPGRAGWHLAHAALIDANAPQLPPLAEDYVCVHVQESAPVIAVDLGFAQPFNLRDELGADLDAWSVNISAGPERYPFEASLGYLLTKRGGDTPPSWNDLEVSLPFDQQGRFPYRVETHWVLFGGSWRVIETFADSKLCTLFGGWACAPFLRRLGLVTRLGLLGSVRFNDFSGAESLPSAEQAASVRLGLGGALQLGLRYSVTGQMSLRILGHLLMPYAADWLQAVLFSDQENPSQRLGEPDYEDRLLWGVSVGVGFGTKLGVEP